MVRISAFLVFSSFPLMACFLLCQGPAGVNSSAQKYSILSGRVVNSVSGVPLARANIMLRPQTGSASPSFQASLSAVTDGEGRFRIEDVEAGTYRITAERTGYLSGEYGSRRPRSPGIPVRVESGQDLTNLTIPLTPPAVIGGRVFDEYGEPVNGASIQVLMRRYMAGQLRWLPISGMRTNDRGEYRASGLLPGKYMVMSGVLNYSIPDDEGQRRKSARKSGYGLTYYPNGTDASQGQVLDVGPGSELLGVDIGLRKVEVFRIKGKVAVPPSVTSRSNLLVSPRDPSGNFGVRVSVPVNEDQSFQLENLAPGSYVIVAMNEAGGQRMLKQAVLDITDRDIDDVVLELAQGETVSGRVTVDGDQKLDYKTLRVSLSAVDGTGFFDSPSASPNADGAFVISGITPQRYRVHVQSSAKNAYLKAATVDGVDILDKHMNVSGSTRIRLTVAMDAGQIGGGVRIKEAPAPGSVVAIVPIGVRSSIPHYFKTAVADAGGRFRIDGVVPGEYRIFAFENVDPDQCYDVDFLNQYESKALRVKVESGSNQTISIDAVQ